MRRIIILLFMLVFITPVPAVADELVLHSMEHGAAVVWYRKGLEQEEIDKITEAFNNSSGKKIMLARKDLDVPVALTSWGYLLKLQTIDEAKIKEFSVFLNILKSATS